MTKTSASIDQIRNFWDENVCGDVFTDLTNRRSKEYLIDTRNKRYQYEFHLKPFLKKVAAAGGSILEVGCSQGIDLAELAKMGCHVTGLDLSPKAIQLAKNRFEFEGVQGKFVVGNAESTGFADASFDVVYSFGVLHHTSDINAAFREIFRILKPGGKIFIMLYSKYSLNNAVHVVFRLPYESPKDLSKDAPVTLTFSKKGVQNLLSSFEGLRIEKEYLFGAGWRPISDIVPISFNQALGRFLGWHWMIEGKKPLK